MYSFYYIYISKQLKVDRIIITTIFSFLTYIIYQIGIDYKVEKVRSITSKEIDCVHVNNVINTYNINEKTIKNAVSKYVRQHLVFSSTGAKTADDIINKGSGHCFSYSHVYVNLYNKIARLKKLNTRAEVVVGKFYFFGFNVHALFKSSIFKDHDMIRINNHKLYDVLFKDYHLTFLLPLYHLL